ncbi:MAG: TetM/TetW/TetO/TetS family tetracycline resistance ribosomal protection protein [Lachnospiraceae bacterium]|nr:TetM/TetW/TetO/TetS family tetracycline resistance ribosomal protection protein [Lachnospiraceae bacterium]
MSEQKKAGHCCMGILAHVDAGKTTLSEGILYKTGAIRKMGRVDNRDAFLDTFDMEKKRGITIYSKQAEFMLGDVSMTLLDTPGHVDFSPEMERALQVLDVAVLVISGADGVQGQVRILWKLLNHYQIPVFLFVNKMDQQGTDKGALLEELQRELDSRCLDFSEDLTSEEMQENLALCREELMEAYLEGNPVEDPQIRSLIGSRELFPVYFGSALKMEGVQEFLEGLSRFLPEKQLPEQFGARVFKISRDPAGTRLTWIKVTGGSLKVKSMLSGQRRGESWQEKVDQIRIYSGAGFSQVQTAEAGSICALTGLTCTWPGEGLGAECDGEQELLEPVLNYSVLLDEGEDRTKALKIFRILEEEEPMLHVGYEEATGEISVSVMGQVQMEILTNQLSERFGLQVKFGPGSIVYKETILSPVEGIGHFEPLRHYAEVHLLLEPGEPGSGLVFDSICREDVLDKNWQRLIMTHLEEKKHKGVLTGSEITDMKITILTGKAHQKHTEGGDFRQSTYRAIRQGLMQAKSVLLEPVYDFRIELPQEYLGRALNDISVMGGRTEAPDSDGSKCVVTGSAPAALLANYQEELTSYSRGQGRIYCSLKGYEPCHNTEEVLAARGYDPDLDVDNPSGSIFCSHGAGTYVPWELVPEYCHLDSGWQNPDRENGEQDEFGYQEHALDSVRKKDPEEEMSWKERDRRISVGEAELEAIFEKTYGSSYKRGEGESLQGKPGWKRSRTITADGVKYTQSSLNSGFKAAEKAAAKAEKAARAAKRDPEEKEYLLVDGYNIIFSWEDLKKLAEKNIDAARDRLLDLMCDYQGYKKCTLIVVFDAYKVKGGREHVMSYHNIYAVYTKEAETADQYIEKTVHEIGHKHRVTVATSDALEQMIILGGGASRMSSQGLLQELQRVSKEMKETYLEKKVLSEKNYLLDGISAETAEQLKKLKE